MAESGEYGRTQVLVGSKTVAWLPRQWCHLAMPENQMSHWLQKEFLAWTACHTLYRIEGNWPMRRWLLQCGHVWRTYLRSLVEYVGHFHPKKPGSLTFHVTPREHFFSIRSCGIVGTVAQMAQNSKQAPHISWPFCLSRKTMPSVHKKSWIPLEYQVGSILNTMHFPTWWKIF